MCRSSPPAVGVPLRVRRSTGVERKAFIFTSGYDTPSAERAITGCDDGVAMLA
jgi:hypothetical protein